MSFLKALFCENHNARPPIWLMRQAGRYLPEYRKLRERYSLWQLFHEPELAAQVTHMPCKRFGFDAAILFSDILVIAEVFGKKVIFPESGGPSIEPAVQTAEDIAHLKMGSVEESLHYVAKTIHLLKLELHVPLIGFCGGPFTLAGYMMGQGEEGVKKSIAWLEKDPVTFHALLKKITEASIAYLAMQIKAGVDVVQIFDSWAGSLTPKQFEEFCLPYLKQIIDALCFPTILFCRGSSLYPQELAALGPTAISFDWQRPMRALRQIVPSHIAVQGNLDPHILRRPLHEVKQAAKELLSSMRGEPGFIVNLGHGVFPDVPIENVQCLVDCVKNYQEARGGIEQKMASGLPPESRPNWVPLS